MAKEWLLSSGLLMGWSLGANDSANIFGTGVASGLIRYRTAILVTAFFVMLGAVLEGQKCLNSLGSLSSLSHFEAFVALLTSALTMTLLTFLALPASTSQAIVGALMGVAMYHGNPDFSVLSKIVICWVLTPIGGIVCSVVLYKPFRTLLVDRIKSLVARNRLFFIGILVTGSYGAYSLGSNNVANVTGVYVISGLLSPTLAVVFGGLSIALGVLTYSKKTMMTVGKSIVPLDPFSALLAVLSEAIVLHVFTQIGVPVSSSQAIVGGVLGVGVVRDFRTVNFRIFAKIIVGWVMTPIISGFLTWGFLLSRSFL
ncbi:MAG: inorganic phosphate transporter [Thermodesulforhabdaceae bacterium]